MEIVKFPSSIEVATYESSPVSNVEANAIVIREPDIDSSSTISVGSNTQGTLYIDFTKGNLTNAIIRLYGSYLNSGGSFGSEWFIETVEDTTSGSGDVSLYDMRIVLTSSCQRMFHFPLGACRMYKITVQGTGDNAGSSIKLAVGLRNN
jgi:hypothetical protein